jgi:protein-disulfide isomerase
MPYCASFRFRVVALAVLLLGCTRTPDSAAADVPDTDVRKLPNDRKVGTPDRMMETADVSRVIGQKSAPVKMLVISDYQCDSCRLWFEQQLPVVRTDYIETGKVRLTWVHYPLRSHPAAVRAASASLCAGAQGKFWEASARLFSNQRLWGASARPDTLIDSLAIAAGSEAFTLKNCTVSGRMLRQVRRDIDWTDTTKAGAPPTVIIGTRRLSGVAALTMWRAAVDSALAGK